LVVIAFVAGKTLDLLGGTKGNSTASLGVVGPVCRAVNTEDGTRICIDERRRFERAYVAIRAVLVVSRCRFAVEERSIDGTVRAVDLPNPVVHHWFVEERSIDGTVRARIADVR
jgi:hypothetical protein